MHLLTHCGMCILARLFWIASSVDSEVAFLAICSRLACFPAQFPRRFCEQHNTSRTAAHLMMVTAHLMMVTANLRMMTAGYEERGREIRRLTTLVEEMTVMVRNKHFVFRVHVMWSLVLKSSNLLGFFDKTQRANVHHIPTTYDMRYMPVLITVMYQNTGLLQCVMTPFVGNDSYSCTANR